MDGLRWFQLVAPVRESLRDNQIQPPPDWWSSGASSQTFSPAFFTSTGDHQVAESAVGESTPTPLLAS